LVGAYGLIHAPALVGVFVLVVFFLWVSGVFDRGCGWAYGSNDTTLHV